MRRAGVVLVVLGAVMLLPWLLAVPAGEGVQAAVSSPSVQPTGPDGPAPSAALALRPTPAVPAAPSPPPMPTAPRPPAPRASTRPTPPLPLHLRPPPLRPAIGADVPDPDILHVGDTWWAYATGSGFLHLQVLASPDLRSWSGPVDALPHLPTWASSGVAWGPAVVFIGGDFHLYYSARDAALGRECLSVAAAATPAGPFVDTSVAPLTCQSSSGGSIDPQPFVAPDGTPYLLWKSEDNALGSASRIGVQQLSPDGRALVGPRPRLLSAAGRWQSGVVEGPSMVAADGRYYLFYGANHWDTSRAAIGYAVCVSPLGPCVDESSRRPWLTSFAGAWGPSGPDVFTGPDGREAIAFHAWDGPPAGPHSARALWVMPLTFLNGVPIIG